MKKPLSLLLAVVLLASLAGCAAAPGKPVSTAGPAPTDAPTAAPTAVPTDAPLPPEPSMPGPSAPPVSPAPERSFDDAVAGQVFAVALAAYGGSFPDGTLPDDPAFLMEATGWYAAWRWRTAGVDILPLDEAEAFQRSLGSRGDFVLDPEFETYGLVARATADDGTEGLNYLTYKAALEDRLGVTLELKSESEGEHAVDAAVIRHFENGDTAERDYRLLFAPNPGDERFPWRLTDLTLPSAGPQMDPAFDFDFDLLLSQNRLSTLLRFSPAVRIETSYDPDRVTWIFLSGGDLCIVNETDELTYGEYRGARFEYGPDEQGVVRARVRSFDDSAGSFEANDTILSDLFSMAAVMKYEGDDGERIRIRSVSGYGYRDDFEIRRGTLALLREAYYYNGDEPVSVVTVSYPDAPPDFSFLDGWDKPLREITGIWEDFYDGDVHVREERYELPGDWEFLPWEGRWGDYTIYMNKGYTRPYFYPGDGMDYTLYLTTAKG